MFNGTNSNAIISKSKKNFLNFFLDFRNLHKILNTLKKSWASQVISYWNYRLGKVELLKCPKSHHGTTLMDSQHFKGSKTLLKLARKYCRYIFWTLWKIINFRNSLLAVAEILRLLVKILTPDDKYSISLKASV